MHLHQNFHQYQPSLSSNFQDAGKCYLLALPPQGNATKLEGRETAKRHVRKNPLTLDQGNFDAGIQGHVLLNLSPPNQASSPISSSLQSVRHNQQLTCTKPRGPVVYQKDTDAIRLKKTINLAVSFI